MFGIGANELAIILVFGFLLFGPDKLPQMGRTIGRALRQFRETQEKMTSMVQAEVIDPMAAAANAPTKSKKAAGTADDDSSVDSDANAPAADASAPRQKETFAERRARLAAEKAQKEEASDSAEGAAADAAEAPATAEEPAEPAPEPEPEERTTADLYARRPRKKKADTAEPAAEEVAPAASDATTSEGGEQ